MWVVKSGQYDDLDGAAHRILFEDDPPRLANPTPSDRRWCRCQEALAS
ncbi:MAG TPA: cbb3-type cytochrome oxidase assembly protein CcoS [Rhodospirillales bacterium]|nr:cbb3-type cytochrome oxidase assembly protein CcoS [Rhodospirillales bacterium]